MKLIMCIVVIVITMLYLRGASLVASGAKPVLPAIQISLDLKRTDFPSAHVSPNILSRLDLDDKT